MKKKKEILISIISLITVVIIVVGVSLAFFNYTQTGTTDNTLETGSITFLYTETSEVGRGISITDALPMTDDEGKILMGEGNVFDFNISSTTASNVNIPYEITLEKLDESGIEGECIKIYLTKVNGLIEEELVLDTFTNLEQTTRTNDKIEKVLYKDAIDVNTSYNQDYRLRMWVTDDYDDKDIYKSFMVKVNVYADGNVGKLCAYEPGQTWNFDYTGGEQEFTVPCSGTYKLEVWGAQGGNTPDGIVGGNGGYAYGNALLDKEINLSVIVGGKGANAVTTPNAEAIGGYNGGGNGKNDGIDYKGGAGGGATHIAKVPGTLASIGYDSFVTQGNGLIIAGGGGGANVRYLQNPNYPRAGGAGGGSTGGLGVSNSFAVSTQTTGYNFGLGQSGKTNTLSPSGAGGGGGLYGGYGSYASGGNGGSGYIGGVTDGSMQNGVQSGNGKATITLVSLD